MKHWRKVLGLGALATLVATEVGADVCPTQYEWATLTVQSVMLDGKPVTMADAPTDVQAQLCVSAYYYAYRLYPCDKGDWEGQPFTVTP